MHISIMLVFGSFVRNSVVLAVYLLFSVACFFTVHGNERIQEESWAPFLQSTVVFGRCHLVENQEATMMLIKKFAMKYYPDEKLVDEGVASSGRAVQMFEIEIEHMSGKEVQER